MKNPFRLPTAAERAQQELAEAELELLKAEASQESARALVTMYQERIARLRARLTPVQSVPRLKEAA